MLNLLEIRSLVEKTIDANQVAMIKGGPGLGKSSMVEQIADSRGCWLLDLRLPQMEPTDLRGIPVPNRETHRVEWYYPSFWPDSNEDGTCTKGPGIVFFDEIEKAPIAVKHAALQIVLDRKVGDYELPTDVAMVCAGNQEEDGTFSGKLGAALANRMVHFELKHDIDIWAKWAHENDVIEDIIAFLHFKPDLLYKNTQHDAFPSPRSWVMASKLIKGLKKDDEKTMKRFITASVGEGVVGEFVAWNTIYRNVDPEQIITKGVMPNIEGKKPDFTYAVAMAVAMYTRKKVVSKYKKNIVKFLNLLKPELQVVFFRQQTQQSMMKFANDDCFNHIVEDIMDTFTI